MNLCSPEIILCKGVNIEHDSWTIGVLTYFLFSGMYPFEDDSRVLNKKSSNFGNSGSNSVDENKYMYETLANSILHKDLAFPGSVWEFYSSSLVSFIKACLVKNSSERMKPLDLLNHIWFN